MTPTRTAASCVAVLIALAFTAPAMAQNTTAPAASAPLKLNQFMKKSAKPAMRARKTAVAQSHAKTEATPVVRSAPVAAAKNRALASAKAKPHVPLARLAHRTDRRPAETAPVQTTGMAAREPGTAPADRVKVMSFSEINELDLVADNVQVMSQDQLNELDATADTPPVSGPSQQQSTTGEVAEPTQPGAPTEKSWLQRILLAVGGVLAAVSAVRLWIG